MIREPGAPAADGSGRQDTPGATTATDGIADTTGHRLRRPTADALRTIRLDEVTSSGNLGYALGVVVVRIPSGPELTTKYATIWQRDRDGRWRLAVDSSSPNP
jgi:ketosteroid isomerase-like protein